MLGRVVDPLAAGRRRAEPGPSRGDLSPARSRSSSRPRAERRQEGRRGRSPSPTSWPRSGGAPPAWNGWPPTLKEPLGDALVKELARPNLPGVRASGASAGSGRGCRSTGRRTRSSSGEGRALGRAPCSIAPFAPGRETTDARLRPRRNSPGSRATAPATSTKSLRTRVIARLAGAGRGRGAILPGPRVPRAGDGPARAGPRRQPAGRACDCVSGVERRLHAESRAEPEAADRRLTILRGRSCSSPCYFGQRERLLQRRERYRLRPVLGEGDGDVPDEVLDRAEPFEPSADEGRERDLELQRVARRRPASARGTLDRERLGRRVDLAAGRRDSPRRGRRARRGSRRGRRSGASALSL